MTRKILFSHADARDFLVIVGRDLTAMMTGGYQNFRMCLSTRKLRNCKLLAVGAVHSPW